METKVLIVSMHGQGKSYREIGKAVGADHKVVSAVIRNWTLNHSLDRKKGGGRPRKTSPQTDGMIVRAVTANRYVSLNDLRENLALRDLSKSTIARRITAVKMMETARAGLQESI